jgi:Leucine-rich repeat (LRR) protein
LDLSRWGLCCLPGLVCAAQHVRSLTLDINPLDSRMVGLPVGLRELNLRDCGLTALYLPPHAGLPRLSTLQLHSNCLADVPESVLHCTALRDLCLSCNRLTSIPDEIGCLVLVRVGMYYCPLSRELVIFQGEICCSR